MLVAQRVLGWERAPAGSHIDITLLSAVEMRRANRRATGRRGLTDVIAYPLPQPDGRVMGDIYICPAAAADAVGNSADLCEELIRLVVHGTLHRALHVARLALLVLGAVATANAVAWWSRPWAEALATLVVGTMLLFIVGDALPRSVARIAPELSEAALPFARRTLAPFGPLLWLLAWADRGLHALVHTPRPLQPALGIAQRDMLLGVFTLADTTVDEVMTPRLDMSGVDVSASTEEVLETFRQSQHTRLPVLDGSPDSVAGVVFGKDLVPIAMGLAEPGTRWQTLIRPAAFVPETKTLDNQLRDFQGAPPHMAIVVDEFGGTSGLITREDILEEIVGEIRDEHDTETAPAIRQDGGRLWVDGRTSLDDLDQRRVTQVSFQKA